VVELFATSPFMVGDEVRRATVRSFKRDKVPAGLVVPAVVPWHIEGQGPQPADPITRFTQRGSVDALPVIEIRDAAHPTLINDVTGSRFAVDYDGTVFVDSAAETVMTDQGDDVTGLVTVGSQWPVFTPGAHRLRLQSRNEYTSATAFVTWTDRWV